MATNKSLSSFDILFKGRSRSIHITMKNMVRIPYCSSHSYPHLMMDSYKILGIQPGASKPQVKKAFRKLAKQYHPDVCKGKDCGVQFEEINAAYQEVMSNLRGESSAYGTYGYNEGYNNEDMKGRRDQHWDYGDDEWIGWEVGNWIFYQHQEFQ